MAADNIVSNLQILALLFLCLSVTTSSDDPSFYPSKFGSFTPHEYTRFADVERHCQSVLSSAADHRVGANGVPFPMDNKLSFMNGDWSQDAGLAPLLPFQGSYADAAVADRPQQLEPVNLASFMLTHMDTAPRRGAGTALNVSGFLTLAITRNCCCSSMDPDARSPEFVLRHGLAKLHIQLEGVYTETRLSSGSVTDGSGGERVLCMVGNSVLPVRSGNSSDPWDWAKNHGGRINLEAPPVMTDDNIVLVLRYPKTRTLATRTVHGEMVSTSAKSGGPYFDKVRLVSSLHSYYSRYQFDEELDFTAGCSEQPSLRDVVGHLNRGAFFCDVLREFTPEDYGVMDVIPNWSCNSTDEFCSPLELFETSRPAKGTATATAVTRPAIAVQSLECEPTAGMDARVSAVFRLVPPLEHQPTAAKRTGLSGKTLSAEGVWSASTGRLCMMACRGVGKEACRHRVTLYVPTTFSITRRSIVAGQITAMDGGHAPVSFRQLVSPRHHWQQFARRGETLRMAYNYTKNKQAIELLRQSERSVFRDSSIARSFLSYPDIAGAADDMASLSNLGEDLGLRFQCSPKPAFVPEWIEGPFFQFQILSVGSLVGSYHSPYQRGEPGMRFEQQLNRRNGVEKQEVLNVSAEFNAPSWKFFYSRPVLSLEGVYNPDDGRMHLIGCRDVYAPWHVSSTSKDLEDGMDCSIQVTVEYPPTTTRWLISPVAKVYIASTRDAADPLHFNRTELRSLQIIYRDQRNEVTEPKVEGLLCIAVLSTTTAATVSQLRYVRSHGDVAPYISLAMLGVQALGYSATLVMDAKTLPAWPTSRYRHYYADHLQWSMDCSLKALTLATLLLTARLAQKVWRSRSRVEPGRVPSDGVVLVYSFVVYLGGLLLALAVHWLTPTTLPPGVPYVDQDPQRGMRTRTAVVERYFGVVKEWFLIPQVIGNAVWRVNSKPLAARYYAGITTAWLLPHIYGYLRPPVVNPEEAQHGALDFYSKAGAVVVPVVGVVLVLAVSVQQRWNYRIVGWVAKGEQNKRQHVY